MCFGPRVAAGDCSCQDGTVHVNDHNNIENTAIIISLSFQVRFLYQPGAGMIRKSGMNQEDW